MIWAYDLDGVLAVAPERSSKKWQFMKKAERDAWKDYLRRYYAAAPVLFNPEQAKFHVITARKEHDRDVTQDWLNRHFPGRVISLSMLVGGRTIETVVPFKNGILQQVLATDYAEDNIQVVRGLRKCGATCRIWHYEAGKLSL